MKIKRYEASNMTEALRKIKKDFGEDAVILSAKTSKKSGGIFSSKTGTKAFVQMIIQRQPTLRTGGGTGLNRNEFWRRSYKPRFCNMFNLSIM